VKATEIFHYIPGPSYFSKRITLYPRWCKLMARAGPATPDPMRRIGKDFDITVIKE
jgi:hypothetical protein